MIIRQIPVGPFKVMTYLVACTRTREAVIIDPAGRTDLIGGNLFSGDTLFVATKTPGHEESIINISFVSLCLCGSHFLITVCPGLAIGVEITKWRHLTS